MGVLNDHTYCVMMDTEVLSVPGELALDRMDECRIFHKRNVNHSVNEAKRLKTTVIFTEFGACGENESCIIEIKNSCDAFDEHAASWTYWMFKGFNDHTTQAITEAGNVEGFYFENGQMHKGKVRELSRTYFQTYQGTPDKVRFNSVNGDFAAYFNFEPKV